MIEPPKFTGVEQITEIFGYWPSFHGAEIKWMRLDCEDPAGGPGRTVEFAIHCFEMIDEVAPFGDYVLRKHTLVHFRFRELSDFQLDGFGHQNAIFELEIVDEADPSWERRPYFRITIDGSAGTSGSFHTYRPEILFAGPCDEHGHANAA